VVPVHVALAPKAEGAAASAVSKTIAGNNVAENEKRDRRAVLITFIT
jgi:hypothetical protein